MRGNKWFILLASLALVLLVSSMGVTRSFLVDLESSTGNTFQAWASGEWVQTTQADFEAGVLTNTVDVQIGANNRDAWDDASSGSLDLCYFGDADWWDAGGYQWSLSIPQGATIDVAYISVYPTWHGGATGAYTARIRVEDVDNPAVFTGAPNNIRGRTYWTTTVDWAIPAGGLPIDQWSDSPSIKDLIQHAVNSPGWIEGNYIGIAIWGQTGNGGCGEGVNDFSSDPSYAAKLRVEYRTVDTTTSPGDVMLATLSDWYDPDWTYRRQITIDHTMVEDVADPSTTYANFPVLVYATGLSNIKANGADIRFTLSDGVTEIPREIESYSGGTLYAWVKVTLTKDAGDSTDDVIYMYYGNAAATEPAPASAYGSQNVWDGNFVMVQHMDDLTTSSTDDSTSNNNDGTKWAVDQPIEVDAKIGKGQDFTPGAYGTPSEYLQIGTTGFSASSGTLEMWAKAEGFVDADPAQYLFGHTVTPGWSQRIQLYTNDTLGNLNLGLGDSHSRALDIQALNINTWYHIVLTWDGTNYVVYVDSVSKATGTYTGLTSIQSLADIGNTGETTARWEAWDGIIDEVRVSIIPRSAEWIKTSYNNQDSPSSFCSVGSEVGMYVSLGTIASRVWDTGVDGAGWDGLFWDEILPGGTDITFEVRASDTLFAKDTPDATLPWTPVGGTSPVTSGLPSGRYMQWRATLTTPDTSETPVLEEVRVYYY